MLRTLWLQQNEKRSLTGREKCCEVFLWFDLERSLWTRIQSRNYQHIFRVLQQSTYKVELDKYNPIKQPEERTWLSSVHEGWWCHHQKKGIKTEQTENKTFWEIKWYFRNPYIILIISFRWVCVCVPLRLPLPIARCWRPGTRSVLHTRALWSPILPLSNLQKSTLAKYHGARPLLTAEKSVSLKALRF